jgi:uncharacterized protein (TIGR02271 family)
MAEWEKVVSVYDTVDKAKSALNVLKSSGIDTSDVSLLDRNTLGTGIDQQHVGLWRRLFGENVWEHEAAVYGDTLRKGGAVLAVRGPRDRVAKIMAILDAHDPVDVHEHAAKIGSDVPVQAKALVTAPGIAATTGAGKNEVLRLAEEQMNVGKRLFETGTTRIRRFVTEKPVEQQVNLHEEHAKVVRRAVNDPDYISDIDWGDKEYTVTETEERPVVSKTARVVEEIAVGREGSDRTETVRDTVRRQRAEIEKLDPSQKRKSA